MELITKEQRETIPNLYDTENSKDPICHVKLFTPDADWTWYVIELSKEDNSTCFGYVQGLEHELGYFSLEELETVRGAFGLPIERDISFTPTALSIIKKGNQ